MTSSSVTRNSAASVERERSPLVTKARNLTACNSSATKLITPRKIRVTTTKITKAESSKTSHRESKTVAPEFSSRRMTPNKAEVKVLAKLSERPLAVRDAS